MTIYGQNNLASVVVPVEGFGGCGIPHSRPVVDGAPKKIWDLSCEPCENFLRHSDQWSVTLTELPETYDETKQREQSEKAGKMDRERQLAVALEQLAPLGQLPEVMVRLLGQLAGTGGLEASGALAGLMECPSGHPNQPGHKFCSTCGSPMRGTAAAGAISAPPAAPQRPAAEAQMPSTGRLKDANKRSLQALCRAHGLDESGTNAELVVRVSNAGLTVNDLAKLTGQPVAA